MIYKYMLDIKIRNKGNNKLNFQVESEQNMRIVSRVKNHSPILLVNKDKA